MGYLKQESSPVSYLIRDPQNIAAFSPGLYGKLTQRIFGNSLGEIHPQSHFVSSRAVLRNDEKYVPARSQRETSWDWILIPAYVTPMQYFSKDSENSRGLKLNCFRLINRLIRFTTRFVRDYTGSDTMRTDTSIILIL